MLDSSMLETDALKACADDDLIPLNDVAVRVGLNRGTQSYAVRHGDIIVADKRGPHGRYLVTRDEALLLLAAGAIAAAVGIAVVVALRAVRSMGAQVSSGVLTIPLPTAA